MNASASRAERILQRRGTIVAVALLSAVLCAVTNLPWQLDDYDQAQQAFTSVEMVKEGHWLYQRTPHDLIAQKPPLIGWISAAVFQVTHSWDLAWRLPSLIAACVLATVLFRVATKAYGAVPGVIALSAFAFNLMSVRLATLVRTDMPLALIIFLLGLMIFERIRKDETWTTASRFRFCLLLTASMWIKGPFGYLFLLPAVGIYQWTWRKKSGTAAWCGWWPWVLALLLFVPWVWEGIRRFPTFYQQVVAFEVLGRLNPTVHRAQPVYFYLLHLLHKFAPWSILMCALALIWSPRRQSLKATWERISPSTSWLIFWGLSGLVIMSLVPSKRVDRVFAVIPPLCLLLASQVSYGLELTETLRRRVTLYATVSLSFGALFTAGYTVWKISSGFLDHSDALVKFGRTLRDEAAFHHWRFEVVSGSAGSEGMLLYLDKMRFIEPEEAIEEWNDGRLDALAVPSDDAADLLPRLSDCTLAGLRSQHRRSQPRLDYVLIIRKTMVHSRTSG